ncbi:MAG: DUF5658 family protein, partial [Thiohalobacterales bacterium]|nr:DUF5658 family protein [Thiohalobacterales bacterium]
ATTLVEKRAGERRSVSMSTVHGAMFVNRRRNPRRAGDHVDAYTDWYGHLPLITAVTIIALCFADAFMTTVLIANGAVEMNILMDWLIQRDIHLFAIVKMTITGIALVVLVMHYNFRIYRYIAVRYVLHALVPVYALLFYYELNLLASI